VEPTGNLLIFGASVRAAAFSALRLGLRPWCADLFADLDLRARCPVIRLPARSYPHGFLGAVASDLPGPWMYTGGLENWPTLVGKMARRRPLWGNNEEELFRARNPDHVTRTLQAAGLPAPAVRWDPRELVPMFRWLVKPIRRAGGSGIRFWDEPRPRGRRPVPVYLQEYIDGEPCAAVYVGDGDRAWFLGLTRQLVGSPWLHAAPFRYCGSIGPLTPSVVRWPLLQQLGAVLARGCGLRGLFGVDGVLRDGTFWPVEVNPRYTASVEVLEHATGLNALAWHQLVFGVGRLPRRPTPVPASGGSDAPGPSHRGVDTPRSPGDLRCVGKAILFAPKTFSFPADGPWASVLRVPPSPAELAAYADIPAAGEQVRAGRPVLTFFARADSPAACEAKLREVADDLDRRLFPQ
jgi:predicted ATP-grasp superfamily ATP-dependent carboligase